MTKTYLEKRLGWLRGELAKARKAKADAEANVFALQGAVQDCAFLASLPDEDAPQPAEPASAGNGADSEAPA